MTNQAFKKKKKYLKDLKRLKLTDFGIRKPERRFHRE